MGEGGRAKALESIPLDRFGTPEEVADAAVFLVTNEYTNNCILNIDGGLSAVWIDTNTPRPTPQINIKQMKNGIFKQFLNKKRTEKKERESKLLK